MEYRALGPLERASSVVGFGAAAISGSGGGYSFGEISEAAAIELVHRAQDSGINIFDTAPIYGFGLSEQRLGRALRGRRRDDAIIVSKCGIAWDGSKRVSIDNSAATTQRMLEQSLRDLDTEQIDVYLVHWPDPSIDIRETYEVLVRAKESGKVGAIGLSNTNPNELTLALEVGPVDVCQGQDSFFESWNRTNIFDQLTSINAGFMAWGTLEKGILTGRVTAERSFDQHDVRSHAPWWTSVDHSKHFEVMTRLKSFLKGVGYTSIECAISHVLRGDVVSTALCGARTTEQIDGLVQAVENRVPDDILDACHAIRVEVMGS